jgi:hypothetical protein
MVKTYDEWKAACENEHFRLSEMSYYLNPNGKERMLAFGLLLNLTGYCDSGKELLDWIDTKDGLQKEDIKLLETGHASHLIHSLRRVVEQEYEVEIPEKPHFWVTFRVDARYVVEVEAETKDEALQIAQEKFSDANFGDASDVDGEAIIVEDENGVFVWEK